MTCSPRRAGQHFGRRGRLAGPRRGARRPASCSAGGDHALAGVAGRSGSPGPERRRSPCPGGNRDERPTEERPRESLRVPDRRAASMAASSSSAAFGETTDHAPGDAERREDAGEELSLARRAADGDRPLGVGAGLDEAVEIDLRAGQFDRGVQPRASSSSVSESISAAASTERSRPGPRRRPTRAARARRRARRRSAAGRRSVSRRLARGAPNPGRPVLQAEDRVAREFDHQCHGVG